MGVLFGTDGIRGVAGEPPLDSDTLYRAGRALTKHFQRDAAHPRILLARDTRESGPWIESILARAISDAGGVAERLGVVSTPAVSLLTYRRSASAGIMISASHNPFRDNGVKVFAADGMKLNDSIEDQLERNILNNSLHAPAELASFQAPPPKTLSLGDSSCIEQYRSSLMEAVGSSLDFSGMRLMVDCAHGSLSAIAPDLFRRLGADVHPLHCVPDGRNINQACGALHMERLQRLVRESKMDFGVAFDGDGDRSLFVDRLGQIRDGDDVLWLLAQRMDFAKAAPVVVGTVMSNMGLEIALESIGLKLARTAVGDRYVLEDMLRRGAILGGEPSGHVILLRHARTGDGLLTTLKVLEVLWDHAHDFTERWTPVRRLPQILLNIPVREKVPFESIPGLRKAEEECRNALGSHSRILLRYSGTEKLARVMVEGEEAAPVEQAAERLAALIRNAQ